MKSVLIIAEAGVNHNGSMDMAKRLVDAAAEAGADYVKFQTFKAEKIVSPLAKKAEYQKTNMKDDQSDSQFEMLKKLELSLEDHHELINYCKEKKISFLSTAFDLDSVDLLYNLGIELFKIPSGEITNLPYLKKIGVLNKQVIVSTGMCVMEEIEAAVNALLEAGTDRTKISVLHCTTDYPTAMNDVNLRAMQQIQKELNVPVGYSDHTLGIEVPIAAVALGGVIVEKHFTLDRKLPGPDHAASLEPLELRAMVKAIRNIEMAMGQGQKLPTEVEKKNILIVRKSIHMAKDILKDHILGEDDFIMLRPGDGISPMDIDDIVGKKTTRSLEKGSKLHRDDFEK